MNTPVNFEIAKLLKDKGFDKPTLNFYFEDGQPKENAFQDTTGMDYGSEFTVEFDELTKNWNDGWLTKKNGDRCFGCTKSNGYLETFSAPTIAEVVMCLYEKHGIWIQVSMSRYGKLYCNILKKESIKSLDNPISWEMQIQLNDFNSPTEAYEAAIEYTLTKLI